MTEIDTATARRIHATADDMKHGDCHTARAVLTGMMPNMLNEIDRLRAENQRLGEERDSLASSLAIETYKYRDAWDENQRLREAVLAGDRVFRAQEDESPESIYGTSNPVEFAHRINEDAKAFEAAADRLRAAVESTGGEDG